MSRYQGNKWDDNFLSIDEAISVTRYRLADEFYRNMVMLAFSGDEKNKAFHIANGLALDHLETILNGNRDVYRKYFQRMEAKQSKQGEL